MKITIFIILLVIFKASTSGAGWLIYHEPEFKGKVIDTETKRPIEGVVVVAEQHAECMGLGHGGSVTIGVKETLTDKNGEFALKAKFTLYMLPWCSGGYTTFIIFKPGYASISGVNLGDALSGKRVPETELFWPYNKEVKFLISQRLIGLPKVTTRDERRNSVSTVSPMPDEFLENQIILIRLMNEEQENIGLQKSDLFKAREFILHRER